MRCLFSQQYRLCDLEVASFVLGWCIGKYSYEGRKFSIKEYQLVAALLASVIVWRLSAKMGLDLSFLLMPVLLLPIQLDCVSL